MTNTVRLNSAGEIGAPVNVARPHLDTLSGMRLDKPLARQGNNPLQRRAGMPVADPSHRQDVEPNRLHGTGKLAHLDRRRVAADASLPEIVEQVLNDPRVAFRAIVHLPERHARRVLHG